MFDEGVALNPEPKSVTEIPETPDDGETDEITGTSPHAGAVTNMMNATIVFRMNQPPKSK
jgi:hypothetical protein